MSVFQASAIQLTPFPASAGFPLQPYPGREGITRGNASSAEPPCAVGLVSGPITPMNSATEPGQPCVSTIGVASSCGERTCMA